MKKLFAILLLFIVFTAVSQTRFSAGDLLKSKPATQVLVNDFAGILTPDQKQALENKLVAFDDSTSTQITVVVVPNLSGYDVADFAIELGRAWGVGGKTNNNGVVLLISTEDRKLNISPGYGLEGALPDVLCKQIIEDVIVPRFKGNDYYAGINNGTTAIMQAVKGEYTAPKGYNKKGKSGRGIIFYIVLAIIILVFSSGGRGGGSFMSRRGSRGLGRSILFGSMLGSGGSSGGGGGSSGGFGGFGGGSFGGGGASGSW